MSAIRSSPRLRAKALQRIQQQQEEEEEEERRKVTPVRSRKTSRKKSLSDSSDMVDSGGKDSKRGSSSSPDNCLASRMSSESGEISFSETDEDESSKPNWTESEILHGFTENGEMFVVPKTRDTVGMLLRLNEIPTLVTWFFIGLTVYVGMPQEYLGFPVLDRFGYEAFPRHYLIYLVIFWRLMYNVFLGYILSYQSRTKGLTKYVRWVSQNKNSFQYSVLSYLLRTTVGCDSIEEKPPEFNAWVLNTQIVNVILPNDVFAFAFFALREVNLFGYTSEGDLALYQLFRAVIPSIDLPQLVVNKDLALVFHIVVYVVGLFLIVFSVWGKFLSHKIIGYYAWFWGDFFFKIDKTLKFDGIFEVFPHPMYTVGYAWMYGTSMISASYQVLALTMFSHISQMGFLAWCEEPHIRRTYGVEFETDRKTHSENILLIRNFDFFRASDVMMAIILTLYIATTIICGGVLGRPPLVSKYFFVANTLVTTLVFKTIISWMLYKQGRTRFWTSHFLKRGQTREQAFEEWKRIQNLLDTVCNISFSMLAWRIFEWPTFEELQMYLWSYVCGSFFVIMLFGISYWSLDESYNALGDFGWFHGDFFLKNIPSEEGDGEGYIARGIYRYFSHPTIIFGKFWLYALTVLCNDADVTAMALLHHALSYLQTIVVEEPHMQRMYQRRIRRSGVMQTLSKLEIIDNKKKK